MLSVVDAVAAEVLVGAGCRFATLAGCESGAVLNVPLTPVPVIYVAHNVAESVADVCLGSVWTRCEKRAAVGAAVDREPAIAPSVRAGLRCLAHRSFPFVLVASCPPAPLPAGVGRLRF